MINNHHHSASEALTGTFALFQKPSLRRRTPAKRKMKNETIFVSNSNHCRASTRCAGGGRIPVPPVSAREEVETYNLGQFFTEFLLPTANLTKRS